jgi:hypothetical protein
MCFTDNTCIDPEIKGTGALEELKSGLPLDWSIQINFK